MASTGAVWPSPAGRHRVRRASTTSPPTCSPGNTLGDIGHAIEPTARAAGYGLLAHHGGHGFGRTMHEAPHVPNEGKPGKGMKLWTVPPS